MVDDDRRTSLLPWTPAHSPVCTDASPPPPSDPAGSGASPTPCRQSSFPALSALTEQVVRIGGHGSGCHQGCHRAVASQGTCRAEVGSGVDLEASRAEVEAGVDLDACRSKKEGDTLIILDGAAKLQKTAMRLHAATSTSRTTLSIDQADESSGEEEQE